jgi:hypothetical protein
MAKYYTGIGSREAPQDALKQMEALAGRLARYGYVLRSGGAPGADSAFENGCGSGSKEIYLPWAYFNNNPSHLYEITNEALSLAATIHPAWNNLSYPVQKLHARNCYQVLGKDLKTPSEFVVCWTVGGKVKGGTATAINLAKKFNIQVYNLALLQDRIDLLDYLKKLNIIGNN